MKALQFTHSVPRYLLVETLGRLTDEVTYGRFSGLALTDVPVPRLPGPDWALVDVTMCGICGSDIAGITYETTPSLEPFVSTPAVLGHEIVGRIVETGAAVKRVRVGDRVTVDPSISCAVRGRAPADHCSSCAAGCPGSCAHGGQVGGPSPSGRPLAPGLLLGAHTDLPGGFSERIAVHESQLFNVPDSLDDTRAVLTEPLSISVHAYLRAALDPSTPMFVIGSGPIALGAIWACRALGHTGPIIAQTKRDSEARLAKALGASQTVKPGADVRAAMLATGATAHKPTIGPDVYAGGGFPVVIDAVGNRSSLDQALRTVAARGKIILLGSAGLVPWLDISFLWAREIQLTGYAGSAIETWRGERRHTFEITLQLLIEQLVAGSAPPPIETLVSHRFPLTRYREALRAAAYRSKSGAFKVVMTPT